MSSEMSIQQNKLNRALIGAMHFMVALSALYKGDYLDAGFLTAIGSVWLIDPKQSKTAKTVAAGLFGLGALLAILDIVRPS